MCIGIPAAPHPKCVYQIHIHRPPWGSLSECNKGSSSPAGRAILLLTKSSWLSSYTLTIYESLGKLFGHLGFSRFSYDGYDGISKLQPCMIPHKKLQHFNRDNAISANPQLSTRSVPFRPESWGKNARSQAKARKSWRARTDTRSRMPRILVFGR